MTPQLVMLAGPNGAGKSTFYDVFLSGSPLPLLNADVLAAETGIDSLEAARILDATRDRMVADGLGFITETVFSDPHGHKVDLLRRAAAAGYEVTLIYIGVMSSELLHRRVDQRIAIGGHDVPRDRIAARFERSLNNLRAAVPIVERVELYDNSSSTAPYQTVATFIRGRLQGRMKGRLPNWARNLIGR